MSAVAGGRADADVWTEISWLAVAAAVEEPQLRRLIADLRLMDAPPAWSIGALLARRLAGAEPAAVEALQALLVEVLEGSPETLQLIEDDLLTVVRNDPSCRSPLHALLELETLHALQSHRIAHRLWQRGRFAVAHRLAGLASATLGADIDPAVSIDRDLLLDHARGIAARGEPTEHRHPREPGPPDIDTAPRSRGAARRCRSDLMATGTFGCANFERSVFERPVRLPHPVRLGSGSTCMSLARAPAASSLPAAEPALRYAFVLGRGRSGTTWIGQILNRHPGCHYKYEPFNRDKPLAYRQWLADLPGGDDADLRDRFDALMRGCDHNVDYPPFVVKPNRRQPRMLLRLVWQAGKIVPPVRGLYHWYGRPSYRPGDWALIKQVNFPNEHLERLDAVLEPHLLAIVRNPFASVSSTFRFTPDEPSGPLRTEASVARVVELLPSVARYGVPQPSTEALWRMSEAAFEALRWRIQSEPLADFARNLPRGLLMSHEEFAGDPETAARRAYAFFGWPYADAVSDFLRYTTGGEKHRPGASASKRQHSIHRDPADAVRRWKRDLNDEQVADIRSVVAGSALLALWPGLLD